MRTITKESFLTGLSHILEVNELPSLSPEQKEQMFFLANALIEGNEKMNLTAITDERGILLRHIADSLTLCALLPSGSRLIDVGCGAGFPSLPLAIARPDLKITALDSTEKRVEYVAATARRLDLPEERLSAVVGRAEELGKEPAYREKFDVATARAVASLPMLAELTLPFVKKGGFLLAMKAKGAEEELAAAEKAIRILAGARVGTDDVRACPCPLSDGERVEERVILAIRKNAPTPPAYPRKFAVMKKVMLE